MNNKKDTDYTLYLVTDRKILKGKDLYKSIEEAIQGGVGIVQLREKNAFTREFYDIAMKVKKITNKYNIPLIINDRLDIVLAVDAEGLHIGSNDIPINIARRLLGKDKILGVSTSSLSEALDAEIQGADYLGVGALFPTDTKKDAGRVSIDDLQLIKSSVEIPVVGIGGINKSNAIEVMNSGIDGIAVVSAILGEEDIYNSAKSIYVKNK
ncbi:thiamine phosphate synthase [Clostridium sp. D2Q-14]|uniref:thiamine phosphate synthase n=1 Tax=Anaeromonas gelatinilytica TaxID=2683194 RepID=UPI00193B1ABB|nr:thiamine phosphate synthase [Anaeromonas gelatinilytica]MBS4534903.1 thiamine phosphate synthase [Anaeromonas gelatinilytica]